MKAALRGRPLWGLTAVAVATLAIAAVGAAIHGSSGQAQQEPRSSMAMRLDQVIQILANPGTPEAHEAAIDLGMETLYGGMRPLPSKDLLEQTQAADQQISLAEARFVVALNRYANDGSNENLRGRALDLKLFIEQMNEVAQAVGEVTARCGEGDDATKPPCDDLHRALNEETGEEDAPGSHIPVIRRSFSVKLRSPSVSPWIRRWQHDISVPVLSRGQCAVVFKETRGLMVRLHLQRITVVLDPWVTTFGVPRGTRVPIWYLSWVPSEYVKQFNVCNIDGRRVFTTVSQRVKQDRPLEFFWRYYPKDP